MERRMDGKTRGRDVKRPWRGRGADATNKTEQPT